MASALDNIYKEFIKVFPGEDECPPHRHPPKGAYARRLSRLGAGQRVEALPDRPDDLHAEAFGRRRKLLRAAPPDQDGPGSGINPDVITILVAVVHDDIEIEGGGDQSPRPLNDIHA